MHLTAEHGRRKASPMLLESQVSLKTSESLIIITPLQANPYKSWIQMLIRLREYLKTGVLVLASQWFDIFH